MKVKILDNEHNRTDMWFASNGFKPGMVLEAFKRDSTYYWFNEERPFGMFRDRFLELTK